MAQMAANPRMMAALTAAPISSDTALPNKILFVQNLPAGTGEQEIAAVFKRFPGFADVRLIPNRPELAFIEFENEGQAAAARSATDGSEVRPGAPLRVAFARR